MPEFWFRYGVTEVSLEVPEEVSCEKLEVKELKPGEEVWRKVTDLAEEVKGDAGSGEVVIAYDHSGDKLLLMILKHLIESLEGEVGGITLITSCWRLDPSEGKEHLRRSLKGYGLDVKVLDADECELAELGGIPVARKLLESPVSVILAGSEPHGILGKASVSEALVLGGFLKPRLEADESLREVIGEAWTRAVEELNLKAITILKDQLLAGDADNIARAVEDADMSIPVGDFDVVIAGCGGAPRDSSFQQVAHVVGLLEESVKDGGLIGVIAECKRGLGSREFLEAAFGDRGSPLDRELIRLLRRVSEGRRIAFTSALPRSLLRSLFDIRGFDTPQDLLTYALRLYSRSARILILERAGVKPVRSILRERS